jgi:NAD(P)-dependent dehydrogenase (short-subunit alcohol dehydrogenase family)
MKTSWTAKDMPSQSGKRILVTGANSGVGWNAALELARAGAEVILAARSEAKAGDAASRIRAEVPQARLQTGILDLADLASVRRFAAEQLADPRPLDTLINNAGVMALPGRQVSADGFELQFATNVLGPFLLTGLLLPAVLRAAAPRVIAVSSQAHLLGGPTPVQDLNSERGYQPVRAYAKTKLENILVARELQRRAGARLLSLACHPGASHTNLTAASTLSLRLVTRAMGAMMQGSAEGAWPTLLAATDPNAKPGGYYGPGGLLELRGRAVETEPAPFAKDPGAAKRLFDELELMASISYPL